MLPTPQQSSLSSIEAMQWQTEMEDQDSGSKEKEVEGQHRWNARDRTVIARMEQYLTENDSIKVEIEELELLLGPEDSEVNLRHILRYARKKGATSSKSFARKDRVSTWRCQRLKALQEEKARRNV